MLRTAAVVQLIFILLMVGFSTYQLFLGRFEIVLGLLPFLMVYYVFVTARARRKTADPKREES